MACFGFQPSSKKTKKKKNEKERDAGRGDVNISPALFVKCRITYEGFLIEADEVRDPNTTRPDQTEPPPGDTGGSISERYVRPRLV